MGRKRMGKISRLHRLVVVLFLSSVAFGTVGDVNVGNDLYIEGDNIELNGVSYTGPNSLNAGYVYIDANGIISFGSPSGTGAPNDVNYLVGTASASLTSEIIVGTKPGGTDISGDWAAMTVVDDSHNHIYSNIDAFSETNLYTILSDVNGFLELEDSFSGDVTGAYDATVVGNDSHDHNSSTIGTATPADDDDANLSTANQIYDWVIGLGYLDAEVDPCLAISAANDITTTDKT